MRSSESSEDRIAAPERKIVELEVDVINKAFKANESDRETIAMMKRPSNLVFPPEEHSVRAVVDSPAKRDPMFR